MSYNGWTNYATWRVNLEFFDGYDLSWLEPGEKVDAEFLKSQLMDYIDQGCENSLTRSYASAFVNDVNFYEIAKKINEENELNGLYKSKRKKRKKFNRGGLFNLFPDLTENQREQIFMAYTNPQKLMKMDGTCNGFSRVVVPSELNGFTRVNYINPVNRMNGYTLNDYELNDYELNGRTARRIARWYKRNAPWSYIGTAVAGVVVADVLTKGAVRKKLGLKK